MNTVRFALTIAGLVASAGLLLSCNVNRADSGVCKDTTDAIEQEVKGFALTDVEGKVSDSSAIQQGARATQNLSRLLVINANLSVLEQNKCPPPAGPITPLSYMSAASDCYQASLRASSTSAAT